MMIGNELTDDDIKNFTKQREVFVNDLSKAYGDLFYN